MIVQVRRDVVRMVHACQSGHPGGAIGCAEILVCLYFNVMKRNPQFSMNGFSEDIFFLSNGHLSAVWYSVLARSGYFPIAELSTFRSIDSRLQGHPATHDGLPGVRIASGSLGQGLSVAIGAALAKKLNEDSSKVFVLMGDGELQEGQIWEAALYAPHNSVDNLIAMVDYNGAQIDGETNEVLGLGDLKAKWEAFGWIVITVDKGNDIEAVLAGFNQAIENSDCGKAVIILFTTQMGNGVDFMMGSHHWHGKAPDDLQLRSALSQNKETIGDY
ncbi:transketolase [Sphingobacterium oryzagri]|uniref:Transketolase n=1 Tax=Sphingobacterium oryzagri TaxID=3025669 RepID=A0ABY7WC70_9SPHI|nr:transketolase [Sphingobacterium sp. KACC 22765]WDF67055.1 transketolase [Sphingobacterium sp. KACC 22765]